MASIVFIAANQGVPWGASEFLWSRAAHTLAASGDAEVTACVKSWSLGLTPIEELRSAGCRIIGRPTEEDERAFEMCEVPPAPADDVLQLRPDLVVISHGDNREGLPWMELCAAYGIRYVSLAHRASEWDWPPPFAIPRLRSAYLAASAAHFVSEHNRRLTEQMICARIPRAAIVRNPYNVPYSDIPDWPDQTVARMACVARLDLESKAHDILFAVLASPKWRNRDIRIDIVGREGPHVQLLRELSQFLDLGHQLTFRDSVDDITEVWAECHALVLPSRREGMPVAIVEAMLSGRPCLVTNVGGCAEIVEHGRSGWIADYPTLDALDRALDLAWEARDEWAAMGRYAASAIRSLVPADPAREYADLLLRILHGHES
jgi:Glycosyltransferase